MMRVCQVCLGGLKTEFGLSAIVPVCLGSAGYSIYRAEIKSFNIGWFHLVLMYVYLKQVKNT